MNIHTRHYVLHSHLVAKNINKDHNILNCVKNRNKIQVCVIKNDQVHNNWHFYSLVEFILEFDQPCGMNILEIKNCVLLGRSIFII